MAKLSDNLQDLNIVDSGETKTLLIGKKKIVLPVYNIPLEHLKYNEKNGRIYLQMYNLKHKDFVDLNQRDAESFNQEIENLIWESEPVKNKHTIESIEQYDQLEVGVVINDGTIVDGNRRFTCLRRLNRKYPDKDSYSVFKAAILDQEDQQISSKEIRKFELTVQFGQEEKVDYSPLNKSLSIYNDIKISKEITIKEMASILNESVSNINKRLQIVDLVNELLDFVGSPNDYKLAESMSYYYALEPLAIHLNKISNKSSESEIEIKKIMYFTHLVTVKFDLPTQTLRDNLVKHIFNDKQEFDNYVEKFNDITDNMNSDLNEISTMEDTQSKIEKIKEIREGQASKSLHSQFDITVQKVVMKKNIEAPIDTLKGISSTLDDLDLAIFLNTESTEIIEQLLTILNEIESKVIEKSKELKRQ